MAYMEFNALSVALGGSFAARIFIPEMESLDLADTSGQGVYPVLVLLHHSGSAAIDWQQTPAERAAREHRIVIIAPDIQHSFGTDMVYGPKFETFLSDELLGICRNLLPITEDPSKTWVAGVGTGGYAALRIATKHPQVFTKAVSINGCLDMGRIVERAIKGEETGIGHDADSLAAVFGDLASFKNGPNDLFATPPISYSGELLLISTDGSAALEENERLLPFLDGRNEMHAVPGNQDGENYQHSLPLAVSWAVGEVLA